MAVKRPLIHENGDLKELPAADILPVDLLDLGDFNKASYTGIGGAFMFIDPNETYADVIPTANMYWDVSNNRLSINYGTVPLYDLHVQGESDFWNAETDPVASVYGAVAQSTVTNTVANTRYAVGQQQVATTTGAGNTTGGAIAGSYIAEHTGTGTVSLILGFEVYSELSNAVGACGAITGFQSTLGNYSAAATVTNVKGAEIILDANSGTITNTYGLYIGDITAGTQTNTPFGVYVSDAGAHNYFAGNTGFGTSAPAYQLESNAEIGLGERASDPANPAEGKTVIWQSNGVGTGLDGELYLKTTAGGVTKTIQLTDFANGTVVGTGGPQNKYDATTAPAVGDDNLDGYEVGSIWVDVTNDNSYICMDATTGAAVWGQIDGGSDILNNFAATVNPGIGDDNLDGYAVGSLWINTTDDDAWICADATTGAAVWLQINGSGGGAPTLEDFPTGLILIEELDYGTTASSSDVVNVTGYSNVYLDWRGVTFPTGETEVNLSDDGITFHDTSGDYRRSAMYSGGSETYTAATGIRLNNGSKTDAQGVVELFNLETTSGLVWANGFADGMAGVDGVAWNIFTQGGGPYTHIRIRHTTGSNLTAGKLRVWGRIAPIAPQIQPTAITAATYSTVSTDFGGNVIRRINHATGCTVTVEPSMTSKQPLTFIQTGAGQITFAAGTGVTINSADSNLKTRVQYSSVQLIPDLDTANTYYLVGDTAA